MSTRSTRDDILIFIQSNRAVTAAEIARGLNLTPAAIRYHLSQLRKDQLVTAAPEASASATRGRPAERYRLSPQASPNNLTLLATALLSIETRTDTIWDQLADQLASPAIPPASLNRRLAHTIAQLNRMNYAARWEAGPHGPRVLFTNCPYAGLAEAFPGLCLMDRLILQKFLGKQITQTARSEQTGAQARCIFESG